VGEARGRRGGKKSSTEYKKVGVSTKNKTSGPLTVHGCLRKFKAGHGRGLRNLLKPRGAQELKSALVRQGRGSVRGYLMLSARTKTHDASQRGLDGWRWLGEKMKDPVPERGSAQRWGDGAPESRGAASCINDQKKVNICLFIGSLLFGGALP